MPFTIRPFRRLPVCCTATSYVGEFVGEGTVWNVSPTGWRFSGDLPLRVGEVCSLTVTLPTCQTVYIAAAAVRWVRRQEYGVETLVMDEESREHLQEYLCGFVSSPRREGPTGQYYAE